MRHIPQRTCVVCGTKAPKHEFVRVVRPPSGDVAVDETGKLNGRGAYLCRRLTCWDAIRSGPRLARTLRTELNATDMERLAAFAATLDQTEALP
jgi:predicted RNA-binding protein YlxR (DUF448 family)